MDRKLLGIYLNDHLAGATTGTELAKRAAASNQGTDFGEPLERLVRQVQEDRSVLERVMESLGISRDPIKVGLGWAGEKVGRLKLNGRLRGYSPLSRLLELELLAVGVRGKLALWRSLERVAEAEPGLERFDFPALATRAETQHDELEGLRLAAAELAFLPQRRRSSISAAG